VSRSSGESWGTAVADRTFEGYRRDDGTVGVRRKVLVLPSVICSQVVSNRIAADVPEAVSSPHDHGCGQIGADNDQTERTLANTARNPNVSGVLVVGLGCEHVQSDDLAAGLAESGERVREISIQGVGGTDECIDRGRDHVRDLVDMSIESTRITAGLGDLTVGIVSSDGRPSTRQVADPLVGDLARAVVDAGGRVVVAGNERVAPHPDAAMEVAASVVADDLEALIGRNRDRPSRARRVRAAADRLTFDEVTRAWGGLPIREVVEGGERATVESGLALVDAPSRFEEAATALAAAGAHVVLHATADGVPTGHPVVPVIKLSGDPETVQALPDDIDVDATTADTDDLLDRLMSVADGDRSFSERHGLTSFAVTRVGPSM
jgi:altronate dehydratase large subunit